MTSAVYSASHKHLHNMFLVWIADQYVILNLTDQIQQRIFTTIILSGIFHSSEPLAGGVCPPHEGEGGGAG